MSVRDPIAGARRGASRRPRRDLVVLAVLLWLAPGWLLAGLRAANADDGGGERPLTIVGSGYSMPVLMAPWIEAFEAETGLEVEVVPTGTSTGPPALLSGRADIAAMTRSLREPEATAIERRFGEPALVLPVAQDEVAVFVNSGNPVEQITLAQIDAVYSDARRCGGAEDITRWGQLGATGAFVDRSIALFGRRPGSGTATFFRTRALCGGRFKDWMRISPGRTSASLRVVESRLGIGFGSLRDQRAGMKALAVAEDASGPFVRPGRRGLGKSDYGRLQADVAAYPLARTLDFVVLQPTDRAPHPALIPFLESVLREQAQQASLAAGYVPLDRDQLATAMARLEALRARSAARARNARP